MDYLKLKKTLLAVFDHFLSCHDISELEEMMQAFEDGKSLVIKLPEAVHREDYKDDVLAMEAPIAKKVVSRIRRKKPKAAVKTGTKQIKICDIPVLMDLSVLSQKKQKELRIVLENNHHIQFDQIMVQGSCGFATASVHKVISMKADPIVGRSEIVKSVRDNILRKNNDVLAGEYRKDDVFTGEDRKDDDEKLRQDLIKKIKVALGHGKKAKPP